MGGKKSKQPKTDRVDPAARQQELTTGGACESSEDWQLSDEDQEWFEILLAIDEGRAPDNLVLAKHLRNSQYVVEQPVREYLADHLEGKTRRPRGRPHSADTVERILRDFVVRIVYARALLNARKIPKLKRSRSTPSELALVDTVRVLAAEKNIHMSSGLVKTIVHPNRTSRRPG